MTRARLLVMIPLLAFLGLAVLFFIRLGSGDPSALAVGADRQAGAER